MAGNVIVGPGLAGATHDISLSDGIDTWGLRLDRGPLGVQEIPQTPSTLLRPGGRGKYGDDEGSTEQRDWTGGRGQEDFANDPTRYFDGQSNWPLVDGRLLPAPQWGAGNGFANMVANLPGDVAWKKLTAAQFSLAATFTMTANMAGDAAYLWVRRRGTPGTLTVQLRDDSAGVVGATVHKTVTATTSTITDVVSVFQVFDWTTTYSLVSGTPYWLEIHATSTDNDSNYWEVGCDPDIAGMKAVFGSAFIAASFSPYFAIMTTTGAETPRTDWMFFILRGVLYAVQRYKFAFNFTGLAASTMYRNGDHGQADSNAGALTTVVDATKAWTTDQWAGARVRIVDGPGDGEIRVIASNTATALTVTKAFITDQTTASYYVIYDTPTWSAVGSLPGTFTVTDVVVANNIAFIACGTNAIKQFRNSGGTDEFNTTETTPAALLEVFTHPDNGVQLWRANATTPNVQHSPVSAWGGTLTWTPTATIPLGDTSYRVTNIVIYDDEVYVLKEDSLWRIKNDRAAQINVGLEAMPESTNGIAAVAQNLFLYFSWAYSVERLYGGTLDDFGPWTGAGLPTGRTGPVSAIEPYLSYLLVAIDGGPSGLSSILVWNGRGWAEIFRGWEAGRRIRSLKVVPTPEGRPKLYFSFGSIPLYLEFPYATLNPQHDSGYSYMHEHVLVESTIDLNAARLPKMFKEFDLIADNMGDGKEVWLDAQFDNDIGTSNWITLGAFTVSPFDTLPVRKGSVSAARYRLRINTNDADSPVVVKATVAEGWARTPVKYQYNLTVKVGDLQRNRLGQPDADPDAFLTWLKITSKSARRITMNSVWEQFHGIDVIVEPPSVRRTATNTFLGWWNGTLQVSVKDA